MRKIENWRVCLRFCNKCRAVPITLHARQTYSFSKLIPFDLFVGRPTNQRSSTKQWTTSRPSSKTFRSSRRRNKNEREASSTTSLLRQRRCNRKGQTPTGKRSWLIMASSGRRRWTLRRLCRSPGSLNPSRPGLRPMWCWAWPERTHTSASALPGNRGSSPPSSVWWRSTSWRWFLPLYPPTASEACSWSMPV